jgi:hypothetical protein
MKGNSRVEEETRRLKYVVASMSVVVVAIFSVGAIL